MTPKEIALDVFRSIKYRDPHRAFHSDHYLRHNQRQQEHLATLGLDIAGSSVLEVGAGIGDHTSFFLDRGCRVVTSDARQQNLKILQQRYPDVKALMINLEAPPEEFETFDIVYCFGVLYHTKDPKRALDFVMESCKKMLLLSTCVSFGNGEEINLIEENVRDPSQSFIGTGCRPTRGWIYAQLKKHFPHVYLPLTQPNHEEFPVDWTAPRLHKASLARAIFVGSHEPLHNQLLVEDIPAQQKRAA